MVKKNDEKQAREREREKKHDATEKTGRIMVQRKEYKVHTNGKKGHTKEHIW